jgi:hypothetical protein
MDSVYRRLVTLDKLRLLPVQLRSPRIDLSRLKS